MSRSMNVGELVKLYELIDSSASGHQPQQLPQRLQLHRTQHLQLQQLQRLQIHRVRRRSSTNMKLSLQTILHPREGRRSRTSSRPRTPQRPDPDQRQTSNQSTLHGQDPQSPSEPPSDHSSYRLSLSSSTITSPTSSRSPSGRVRRQPSAVDLALMEEQFAEGPEYLGLNLLEPRPNPYSIGPFGTTSPLGWSVQGSKQHVPALLDDIFEVLEAA